MQSLTVTYCQPRWSLSNISPDTSGENICVHEVCRAAFVRSFHSMAERVGYGDYGLAEEEWAAVSWEEQISKGNQAAMVAILLPYLPRLKSLDCSYQCSHGFILRAFEHMTKPGTLVRVGTISSFNQFASLTRIVLNAMSQENMMDSCKLLNLLTLPALAHLNVTYVKSSIRHNSKLCPLRDQERYANRSLKANEWWSKAPLAELLINMGSLSWQDVLAILQRAQIGTLEVFRFQRISYHSPIYSASKLVEILLARARRSLKTLSLTMSLMDFGIPFNEADEIHPDVDNEIGTWAVGPGGFSEFESLEDLSVEVPLILGGFGRRFRTSLGTSRMKTAPQAHEWKLADMLPRSLKKLTVLSYAVEASYVMERLADLLLEGWDAVDKLESVTLCGMREHETRKLMKLCERRAVVLNTYSPF